MISSVDVVIFGAGPAGLAVALQLLQRGCNPIIVNRPPKLKPWGGETLSGSIRGPLTALGCWDSFTAAGHVQGYERQSAWGGGPMADNSIMQPFGCLWHVDRDRFDEDLRAAAVRRGQMIHSYRNLDSISKTDNHWLLVFDGRFELTAKFLVDATGRSRTLARRLGATIVAHDRLLGLVQNVAREDAKTAISSMMIEATPYGWWYAAPTPRGHVLGLFTDADLAPAELRRQLRPVAANSVFTHFCPQHGWIPVGDACASYDPLCGWGVHRAMTNGIRAADAISDLLVDGNTDGLEKYQLHCRSQFLRYLEGLIHRYSFENRWQQATFWERRRQLTSLGDKYGNSTKSADLPSNWDRSNRQ